MDETGAGLCRFLDWDSAFFGLRIARLTADRLAGPEMPAIDAWCRDNAVDCLYFLARSDDPATVRLAEDHHFRLVDLRTTYARDLPAAPPGAERGECPAPPVRTARPEDVAALRQIARQIYHATRFYTDPGFPTELCDRLYETWIAQSCQGRADRVLVAELAGRPAGYLTCQLDREQQCGSIGLCGVSAQARGKRLGPRLVEEALSWFAGQGMRRVSVVTQGRNVAAQRLYQRCGFMLCDLQFWYHRWYRQGGTDGQLSHSV